jgi:nucleoside-diphosphate-sugar epimerase
MLGGKTFLITGATGRLGCETAARLEELGADVLPVVLNGYPQKPKRVQWFAKKKPIIIEAAADLRAIKAPDYVINFHWLVDRTLSFTDQLRFELDYGLQRISYFWDWLKKISCHRLANISSIKVYSQLNSNPISVATDPRPLTPYGLAKLTAERFLDAYFYPSKIPATHLRLCTVASCGEHPSQMLSQFFRSAFGNKAIKVNCGHTVSLLYIDEAVDIIINAALQADRSTYILAAPSMAVDHIARLFEDISGKKLNAEYVDLRPETTDPAFQSDIPLLHASWVRRTSLDSMIKKIIEQYLAGPVNSGTLESKVNCNDTDHRKCQADKASV